jgi:hypothetical protein
MRKPIRASKLKEIASPTAKINKPMIKQTSQINPIPFPLLIIPLNRKKEVS